MGPGSLGGLREDAEMLPHPSPVPAKISRFPRSRHIITVTMETAAPRPFPPPPAGPGSGTAGGSQSCRSHSSALPRDRLDPPSRLGVTPAVRRDGRGTRTGGAGCGRGDRGVPGHPGVTVSHRELSLTRRPPWGPPWGPRAVPAHPGRVSRTATPTKEGRDPTPDWERDFGARKELWGGVEGSGVGRTPRHSWAQLEGSLHLWGAPGGAPEWMRIKDTAEGTPKRAPGWAMGSSLHCAGPQESP